MGYKIRAVRREDWERLRELRLAALADPVAQVAFNESYVVAASQGDAFWQRRAAQGESGRIAETFIGEDVEHPESAGRWAGMLTVLWQGDNVQVVGVYLRPEHRGTGLADELFETAEEWAGERREVRSLRLHVHERNPRAERFYRRRGFTRTGSYVPDPKAPRLREYEMERQLPQEPGEPAGAGR